MQPSAPLLIPASRDTQDNRPDTSGHIPGVHYNVPMYQPLQHEGGVGPGNPIVNGLMRIMYGLTAGTTQDAKANFNPTTTNGLINLAGIVVPGMKGMRGEPTPGQQQFLNSIYNSSRGQGASFRRVNGDGVPELFTQTGTPQFPPAQGNKFTAHNPLQILLAKHGASGLGAILDSPGPKGVSPFHDTTDMTYQQMLDYLFHDYKGNS